MTSGAAVPVRGAWSTERVHAHLDGFRGPIRLAFVDHEDHPRVLSLWYLRDGEELCCATQEDSLVARSLVREPRVGFEVAGDDPPYKGTRGRGVVRVDAEAGPDVLEALIARQLEPGDPLAGWLRSRADAEVALRIRPEAWITWDYSERMTGRR